MIVTRSDLGRHVVGDAEGQVLLDALHAVAVLLLGRPQVLLQGASKECNGLFGSNSDTHTKKKKIRGRIFHFALQEKIRHF